VGRAGVTVGEKGRLVRIGGSLVFERSSFGPKDDGYSSAPSIEAAYDTHRLVGFERGVRTVEAQANLVVDTRDEVAATSRGIRAAAFVGAVPVLQGYGYAHVGADVTGTIDLYKGNRVLVLRGAFEGVHGPQGDVPFARLARLGGPDSLRGHRIDRYRDRDSALLSAEYRYPIHDIVAGALFVDAGHVAPDPASLTAVDRWRAGAGIGLRIRTKDAFLASLDLAYGDGVQLFFTVFPFESRSTRSRIRRGSRTASAYGRSRSTRRCADPTAADRHARRSSSRMPRSAAPTPGSSSRTPPAGASSSSSIPSALSSCRRRRA
jgi:hypothetical protein